MAFEFRNLDVVTRAHMIDQVLEAEKTQNLYFSKRFSPEGQRRWPNLLRQAAKDHNEHWLAYQLEANACFINMESRHLQSGGYTIAHVPCSASETMAEGQFNRFYMLGLCHRAIDEGKDCVTVYRAKEVTSPREESCVLIGKKYAPKLLMDEIGPVEKSLRHELLRPNSGLSIFI